MNRDATDAVAAFDDSIAHKVRAWLGQDGLTFFTELKTAYGKLAVVLPGAIPRCAHLREGMRVRNYLRTVTDWTQMELDNTWESVVLRALELPDE
jgi:hypothetical protein